MKFGKEFSAQMVQEWQEAYMDYNKLKTILKDIAKIRQIETSPPAMASTSTGSLKRRVSLYRAFSGLTNRRRSSPNYRRGFNTIDDNDDSDEVILVTAVQGEGQDGYNQSHYQTKFLMTSDSRHDCDYEKLFFEKLDVEFNKVLEFYKGKVDEVMNEADDLNKQMDALIALRIMVDEPVVDARSSPSASIVSSHRTSERAPLDSIQEVEMSHEVNSDEENREEINRNHHKVQNGGEKFKTFRPASVDVLNHVKINVAPETPVSTLKGMLLLSETNLNFSKEELKKAEHLMVVAFVEFYQRLRLLKSYSYLNIQAFSKILKKYDKITSRNASKAYMKMVENSYLGNSEEVPNLMKNVEKAFIKHFANGNRRKGMEILRPKTKREKHRVTFFLGLLGGCSIALIVAILIVIRARDIFNTEGRRQYMDVIFPLYCLFGFIVLHLLMYAGNIYFWRRYRVNYTFIFGFKNGTELGYREVLLVSSGLMVLTLAGVLSNLDMQMDPNTQSFKPLTELVPLGLLVVVV